MTAYRQPPKEPPPASKDGREHAAFMLHAPKRPIFEDLVDMTAMVDIVFFLLIFFMVTSMQGLYSSIEMPSPDPQKSAAKGQKTVADYDTSSEYVVVRIDRDSAVWIENAEVLSEQDLRAKLRDASQGAASKMLVLSSGDAEHGKVVMVLDAGNDAGMKEVQLAIDEDS